MTADAHEPRMNRGNRLSAPERSLHIMSRSKRFVTGLLSSYAAIGVNILYTIASIPLALHYLGKEEFGLWVLVVQLSGYLTLVEFGMSGSVARSLSDHKDHVEDGIYGNILRTGARVFVIQGVFVTLLGLGMAWFAQPLLNLPERLQAPFALLMSAQALLTGIKLALGSLGSPLWCHQRLDLSNLAGSVSLLSSFAVLWLGFHLGWHIYSLIIASAIGLLCGMFIIWYSCHRLGYYPPRQHRGRFDPKLFRELFHFGSGLFMMNLGAQLTSASQVVVVTSMLGVETAAVWSISTKIFSLATQFVAKIIDSSAGGLAEMVVRFENERLRERFCDLVAVSAVMAVTTSAGIALMNGAFVEIWTSGRVSWLPWNNLLLACVLLSTAVSRCHTSLVGFTKQIRGMKYIYLLEGFTFVLISLLLVRTLGLSGLLIAALLCNIAITGSYGVARTAIYFGIPKLQVIGWIARPIWILLVVAVLFSITCIPVLADQDAASRFLIGAAVFCIVILPSIWFFGMSHRLRSELARLLVKSYAKILVSL